MTASTPAPRAKGNAGQCLLVIMGVTPEGKYDFPAEHWQHLRTKMSRATFLGLAFKLMEKAKKTWRRIRGSDKIGVLSAA